MACDPETGKLRLLDIGEILKNNEVLFQQGEVIEIKGCKFVLENVYPNPQNFLILKGIKR